MGILVVSGDPTGKGKVNELLSLIAEHTSDGVDFISLKDYDIGYCRGCFGCVDDNQCVVQDDWTQIGDKVKEADTLVLGIPTYYGAAFGINALMHSFLERWFSLRHKGIKLNLKKVILVIVSGGEHEDKAASYLQTFFQMYHGIDEKNIEVISARGSIPCLVCGEGETCPVSFVIQMMGEGVKITEDMIPTIKDQPEIIERSKNICRGAL
ncbi:hypothetical protein GC105_15275 [Alkalibaculum sp. M08DMB]|uniref:NADPH-dependent FMN reductase-like domain-containing protein n=1 Tax=Alkalibaculum sporogenes TaxID=2655001 RepID=A0A6A7KC81_9FIRM|nr:flavodoxin family protein [Alkalibaculum sporogenes]MPW27140.1 hypothetical protein [Alkalibaculum sporogenes]